MLKHARRTSKMRGLPRPSFRRCRFLSRSWPARINEMRRLDAVGDNDKRRYPTPGGAKRESGVSLEFEDMLSGTSSSQMEMSNTKSNRLSCFSDTSSAYSGSDNMASCQGSLEGDLDFSDLLESRVDSDDDDITKSVESLSPQDTLKDCLEKDPSERTEKDIEMLLDFVKQLEAFAKMTLAVQRDICSVMVFAAVENAGTELIEDGDEMDSWCVIIDGCVEVVHPSGETEKLNIGDCFGVQPTMEKLYHRGVMRTCCDDCQFVCITQNDYYRILHQGEENIRRHEEGGRVVLVIEQRGEHQFVIQGSPEKLIEQLIKDKSTYVEDFLLTHRAFIDDPFRLPNQLQKWFNDPNLKGRVSRIVLLWVQNHFNDFESSPEMMTFLETFLSWLEQEKMSGELNMLVTLLEMNARARNVVVTRSSRDETLQFSIKGGSEQGFGIFVSQVDKHTKAEKSGLLRGDQILEVNGQNFETSPVTHEKALKVLRDSTHLSITVKSNMIVFKELLHTADTSRRRRGRVSESTMALPVSILQLDQGASLPSRASRHNNKENKGCAKSRFHRVLTHFGQPIINFLSEKYIINGILLENSLSPKSLNDTTAAALPSSQNTDVARSSHTIYGLKVYKSDQTFKYLIVHSEMTSQETVEQALKEFDICEPSCHYSMYEVSVGEGGLFKQSRLPDQLQNLAGRIGLNSRYYLKESGETEPLMPDELVPELIRESKVQFLHLNSAQVAIQLTLQDFSIFKQIESTEYVDLIFKRKSRYGTPVLTRFAELVNREMFWVITEVCSELNVIRRSKIIKQFIKLARECKVCNNFNSMFAILSGLGYRSVARLKLSWEKVPAKYQKMFSDLEEFMDTSRNMSKYRQYVSSKISKHPIIPFYPLVNKDLTFIHEGNETYIDDLINFEKLRKFSSVVRWLNSMCSCPYDLFTTLEQDGQTSSNAMKTLNLNLTSGTYQTSEDYSTLNRRKNSPVTLNARKLFEEAQMVRRVKEYLNNIRVITDEEKLYVMSLMCEAPLRKRQPSPGVSSGTTTTSRKNSAGTKFVVESALSVRKLLSLSEPIRYLTHQPRSLTSGPEAQNPDSSAPSLAKSRRGSFSFATSSPMLQQQQHSGSTNTIGQRKKTVSDNVLK